MKINNFMKYFKMVLETFRYFREILKYLKWLYLYCASEKITCVTTYLRVRRSAARRTHWTFDVKSAGYVNNWDSKRIFSCCYIKRWCKNCMMRQLLYIITWDNKHMVSCFNFLKYVVTEVMLCKCLLDCRDMLALKTSPG